MKNIYTIIRESKDELISILLIPKIEQGIKRTKIYYDTRPHYTISYYTKYMPPQVTKYFTDLGYKCEDNQRNKLFKVIFNEK